MIVREDSGLLDVVEVGTLEEAVIGNLRFRALGIWLRAKILNHPHVYYGPSFCISQCLQYNQYNRDAMYIIRDRIAVALNLSM